MAWWLGRRGCLRLIGYAARGRALAAMVGNTDGVSRRPLRLVGFRPRMSPHHVWHHGLTVATSSSSPVWVAMACGRLLRRPVPPPLAGLHSGGSRARALRGCHTRCGGVAGRCGRAGQRRLLTRRTARRSVRGTAFHSGYAGQRGGGRDIVLVPRAMGTLWLETRWGIAVADHAAIMTCIGMPRSRHRERRWRSAGADQAACWLMPVQNAGGGRCEGVHLVMRAVHRRRARVPALARAAQAVRSHRSSIVRPDVSSTPCLAEARSVARHRRRAARGRDDVLRFIWEGVAGAFANVGCAHLHRREQLLDRWRAGKWRRPESTGEAMVAAVSGLGHRQRVDSDGVCTAATAAAVAEASAALVVAAAVTTAAATRRIAGLSVHGGPWAN